MRTGILPGPLSNPLSVLVIGLGAVLARVWRACRLQTGSCFGKSMAGVPTTDSRPNWLNHARGTALGHRETGCRTDGDS